ncbi:MAG: carbohydrate ABC transporter permease, partial [Anaerolineae bacterium]|nr:carbohydrate ABC transporter permease [Anaerolineae bacterium]
MLLTSFKDTSEIYRQPMTVLPERWTLTQYATVSKQAHLFPTYMRNSFLITLMSVALVTVLCVLAGYSFGRLRYKARDFLFLAFLFVLGVPNVVFLIPVYLMLSKLKLLNNYLGLILPYVALNLPIAILIMRGTFRGIPGELEDAARIDGCGFWQTLTLVMLPLSRAGLVSAIVFTFLSIWEEFLFAVTLMTKHEYLTISVGINFLKDEAQSWAFGTLSAVVVLSVLPALVLFVLAQRYYVAGFLEGALKR